MTRTGSFENPLDLRAISKPDGTARGVDRQLPGQVARDLPLVVQEQSLEVFDAAEAAAVRQHTARVDWQGQMEFERLTVLPVAGLVAALAHRPVAIAPAAQHVEALQGEPGRVHLCVTGGAGLL